MTRNLAASRTTSRGGAHAGSDEPNVLGRGVRVRGRLQGEGDLRIEGEIDGDVRVSGFVEIAEGGSVHGEITGQRVVVEGTLEGDVTCEGTIVVRGGAKVRGDLRGTEIALDETAGFVGRIEADFELPDGLLAGSFVGDGGGSKPARRGR
jgi:cytoskeletal protein CcmA (bactofilin family)